MTKLDTIPFSQRSFDQAMQTLVCFTEGTPGQIKPDDLASAIAQDSVLSTWFEDQRGAAQTIVTAPTNAKANTHPNPSVAG